MTQNLADNLRKLRVNARHSQEFVAKKVGVSLSTYSRFEKAESEIDLSAVVKLATLYKLTVDQLLNYGDPNYNVKAPIETYKKKWSVPVTVTLDGTKDNLKMWFDRLTAINGAI